MHLRPAALRFSIVLAAVLLIAPASADTYAHEFSFGSLGSGDGQFNNPFGIAVNASGYVCVADTNNYRIQVFSADGTRITGWGSFGIGDSQFMFPYAVAVNASGSVHVADNGAHKLKCFTPSGALLGVHPFPENVRGIAIDGASPAFCTDWKTATLNRYNATYGHESAWGGSGSGDGTFLKPTGIAVTAAGVVVADTDNNRVQVISGDGTFLRKWPADTIAGDAGGDFDHPYDVAVNTSGFLFVTDTGNDRVEIFTAEGEYLDTFSCHDPRGIAIGPGDRVYVTSAADDCVHVYRIPPPPSVTGIAPSSALRGTLCLAVTVNGSDFQDNPAVSLRRGGDVIPAENVTRLSPSAIACTFNLSAAGAGTWDVGVVNDDGKEGTLPGGFAVVNPPPHIAAIAPDEGVSGDTLDGVVITGSGFLSSPAITLRSPGLPDIVAGCVVRINATRLSCSLDLAGSTAGARDVIVGNPDGQQDTLAAGFTVRPPATPAPTATPAPEPLKTGDGGASSTGAGYAADIGPGENCTLRFSTGPLQTVTLKFGVPVDSVLVTAEECPLPPGVRRPNGTLYRCAEVTLYRIDEEEVEAAWFTFAIPVSWLEGEGFPPAGVAMLRLHDGSWQELPTACTGEKEGRAWFVSRSPGCSLFAIICRADSSPDTDTGTAAGGELLETPAPTPSPAASRPPDPAGAPPAPKSPLVAAPVLSLPLTLLLRRHRR